MVHRWRDSRYLFAVWPPLLKTSGAVCMVFALGPPRKVAADELVARVLCI